MLSDAKTLSQSLAQNAESVCRELLPQGKRIGSEWCAGSVNGELGSSLKVHLEGLKAGVWSDFATNQRGDLLDLWREVKGLTLSDAMKQAASFCGISPQLVLETPKSSAMIQRPVSDVKLHALCNDTLSYLTRDRGLSVEVSKQFVQSDGKGNLVFPFYGVDSNIKMIKYRDILPSEQGKKSVWCEKGGVPSLFGWQGVPQEARQIVICEGEIDALSWLSMGYPALSVPFGAGNHAWIETEWDNLARFDTIYVCFDADEAGQKGAQEVIKRLGAHRCLLVDSVFKDANEALVAGMTKEFFDGLLAYAQGFDPDHLKSVSSFLDKTLEAFYPENTASASHILPWLGHSFGIRPSELTIWTGVNGHGKSQILGHAMLEMIKQGEKVCIASMEMPPQRVMQRLTRQITCEAVPSPERVRESFDWLSGKLWFFNVLGQAKTESLLETMEFAARRYGVTQFVVDSLLKCGLREDAYSEQKLFVERLCDFKNRFNCHVHLVCHVRKSESEAQRPDKMDIRGAGALSDLADNILSIWRNKAKEEMERNSRESDSSKPDGMISCQKQRNGEDEPRQALWFDRKSFQYFTRENLSKPYI